MPELQPWMDPLDGSIPTLDDGRPATFVAVTTDYAAVEVDTVSGDVVNSIAQVSTREAVIRDGPE